MPETVAQYGHRHEAEYAQGFLEDQGIPSQVFSDDAGGGIAGMESSKGARVVVPDELVERAREVLRSAKLLE